MTDKMLNSYALKYSRFQTKKSKNAITMLTYLSPKRKKLLERYENLMYLYNEDICFAKDEDGNLDVLED